MSFLSVYGQNQAMKKFFFRNELLTTNGRSADDSEFELRLSIFSLHENMCRLEKLVSLLNACLMVMSIETYIAESGVIR